MDYEQIVEFIAAAAAVRRRDHAVQGLPEHASRSVYTDERWRIAMERTPLWLEMTAEQRIEACEDIAPILRILEEAGLLAAGERSVYQVKIDDPDMTKWYCFDRIEAFSADAAAMEAARLAIRADPTHGMSVTGGAYADWVTYESPALVEAVAMYATVEKLPIMRQEVKFDVGR